MIEANNHADNTIYTCEKTLARPGDKVPAELRSKVEDGVKLVRDVLNGEDSDAIRKSADELGVILQQVGASMYQQQPGGGGPTASAGADTEAGDVPPQDGTPPPAGDDVVDGEFKNV